MPTSQQHKRQFESNMAAISAVQKLDTPPNDWLITMAFYAAVHLIEGIIVQTVPKGTGDHKIRKEYINRIAKLKPIGPFYSTLENYSHKSRYQCKTFKKEEVDKILGYLKAIQDKLQSA
ncbi:hypothetical protein [Paenibacillus polymyxa]|uniref:hypothetical protein n=1 Tax=Paenibacillus polymyxa TaxID=1406 RepID=UPI003D2C1D7C